MRETKGRREKRKRERERDERREQYVERVCMCVSVCAIRSLILDGRMVHIAESSSHEDARSCNGVPQQRSSDATRRVTSPRWQDRRKRSSSPSRKLASIRIDDTCRKKEWLRIGLIIFPKIRAFKILSRKLCSVTFIYSSTIILLLHEYFYLFISNFRISKKKRFPYHFTRCSK